MSVALKVGHFSCHKVPQLLCLSPNSTMEELSLILRTGVGNQYSTGISLLFKSTGRLSVPGCANTHG